MQAPMDITQKKIVIFDLDGTLTETKSPMDGEMTGLFRQLLEKKRVAVISGGGFGQLKNNCLRLYSVLLNHALIFFFSQLLLRVFINIKVMI